VKDMKNDPDEEQNADIKAHIEALLNGKIISDIYNKLKIISLSPNCMVDY